MFRQIKISKDTYKKNDFQFILQQIRTKLNLTLAPQLQCNIHFLHKLSISLIIKFICLHFIYFCCPQNSKRLPIAIKFGQCLFSDQSLKFCHPSQLHQLQQPLFHCKALLSPANIGHTEVFLPLPYHNKIPCNFSVNSQQKHLQSQCILTFKRF